MHNFDVAIVDCSYIFRLLQSNLHQAVYQKCKSKLFYIYLLDEILT